MRASYIEKMRYTDIMDRIYMATGAKTQAELARILDVTQSTVADAKKRRSIPAEWLLRLYFVKRLNPEWILWGNGGKYLQGVESSTEATVIHMTDELLLGEHSARVLIMEFLKRVIGASRLRDKRTKGGEPYQ